MAIRGKPVPKALAKPKVMVCDAIDALRGMSGASLNQITNYIAGDTHCPKEIIEQHVKLAIKKGMDHGYLVKTGTLYTVHQCDEETEQLVRSHRRRSSRKHRSTRSKSGKSSKRRRKSSRRAVKRRGSVKSILKGRKCVVKRGAAVKKTVKRTVKRGAAVKRRRSSTGAGKARKCVVKRGAAVKRRRSSTGAGKARKCVVKRGAAVKGRKSVVKRGTAVKKTVKRRRSRSPTPRRASPRHRSASSDSDQD